jgi:TolB protein
MQLKMRFGQAAVGGITLAGLVGLASVPAIAQTGGAPGESAPTTVVVSGGGNRSLFKIALPKLLGDEGASASVVETETRDLNLSSLFQVLDPASFTANLSTEGSGIDPVSWRNVGAEGVVKGSVFPRGGTVHLEMRLFVVSRGADAVLKHEYDVPVGGLRGAVHQFDNEVVKWLTGTAGSFGTTMVYSATTGRGQKGIFEVDSDGQGAHRLQSVSNVALAPAIGPGGVYYSGGLADGTYALFKVGNPAAVLQHSGLVFGVAFGAGKMALVISQGGQSDIYVGNPDGTALSKVTQGGLNTHPAFGPGGELAYVSNGGGNPQIYVSGKRASWSGTYNMAPTWCNDPEGTKLVYMGRAGATWDIFSVDPGGSQASMKRLTQDQGSNTYPACSPDGRSVAFFSSRGGLYLMNNQGQNQQKIAAVSGESLRWQ